MPSSFDIGPLTIHFYGIVIMVGVVAASWLALAGGLASLLATLAVWGPIAANQPLWPLPGVYLIEIPAIGLTG